jgi:hypothetical protein
VAVEIVAEAAVEIVRWAVAEDTEAVAVVVETRRSGGGGYNRDNNRDRNRY